MAEISNCNLALLRVIRKMNTHLDRKLNLSGLIICSLKCDILGSFEADNCRDHAANAGAAHGRKWPPSSVRARCYPPPSRPQGISLLLMLLVSIITSPLFLPEAPSLLIGIVTGMCNLLYVIIPQVWPCSSVLVRKRMPAVAASVHVQS
jgi:hypothetical protein